MEGHAGDQSGKRHAAPTQQYYAGGAGAMQGGGSGFSVPGAVGAAGGGGPALTTPGGQPIPGPGPANTSGLSNAPPPAAAAGPSHASKPIRRRMRMITSCLECRRRKLKCNKADPCNNCLKFSRDCLYLGPKLDEVGQMRLTEMKERVGSLERQLERDVVAKKHQTRILADDVEDDLDEERDLEASELVALDITYEEDVDDRDDIIDLGVQVGRMRITERIGGLSRPRISEEISAGLSGSRGPPGAGGPPRPGAGPPGMPGQFGGPPGMGALPGMNIPMDGSIPEFLRPGPEYIPPSSGFFFGLTVDTPSLEHLLLPRHTADQLIQQYFHAVHPIARCVHRSCFEADYQHFWDEVYSNYEPRPSLQAVVFAAMFSAAISLDEAAINQFGFTKASMIERLKLGTETALSKASFLRTTRVETMQAFVMYMIPLCRAEVSRAHSVLVGAAVRMAECMGLHRDGETYGLNPLDTHVRRLIWHQLCFLDIRTCEAQGPRPAIRREDYDTKLPINCEEEALVGAAVPPEPLEAWSSTLLPIIRFEINEMMRIIWVDRRKLENRKITLITLLSKIESFRRRIFDKYDRFIDERVPLQRYTKLVMHLLLYRLHAMVLHPYHANANSPMPHRLNNVLIMAGIMIVEISIQLETDHLFRAWTWYLGAYTQYHIALLLATEVYYRPQGREAARIWGCLDYVFNMDRNMPPEAKGMRILGEIMQKTAIYQSMRKMRAPTSLMRASPKQDALARGGAGAGQSVQAPPQGQTGGGMVLPPQPMTPSRFGGPSQATAPQPKMEPGLNHPSMPPPAMGSGGGGPGGPPTSGSMGPPPNIVFAGVSNGEALWSVPQGHPESPGSGSDGSGDRAPATARVTQPPMPGMVPSLDGIDWEVVNTIFPQDPRTGELNISGFDDPSLVMNWQR